MKFSKWALAALLASSLSASFHGCAGKGVDSNDPAALMSEAEDELKSDHYQIAIDKFKEVKNKFPYSKYSVDAQLRLADVYFMQESYADAAAQYETFRDLHPKHEKVPYALFRIGKSYFNDAPSAVARDMTSAKKSVDAYNEFLRRFPAAPEGGEAKKDLTEMRGHLAEKELYIADFYFKRDFFASAKPRYQKVIDQYSETPSAQSAKEKLEKIAAAPANAQ